MTNITNLYKTENSPGETFDFRNQIFTVFITDLDSSVPSRQGRQGTAIPPCPHPSESMRIHVPRAQQKETTFREALCSSICNLEDLSPTPSVPGTQSTLKPKLLSSGFPLGVKDGKGTHGKVSPHYPRVLASSRKICELGK